MTSQERERLADLKRKAALTARWKAAGACTRCGLPVERFARCLPCRRKHAKWALAWYHKQKPESACRAAR